MVLKLYATGISPPSRVAALALLEKKVPFELVNVDLAKGEQKSPANVANQPFGQIPYIDDDGFILYESRAIARYIATKYADQGTKLIPTGDPKAHALFEQATFTELAHFNDAAFSLFVELIVMKLQGKSTDQAKADSLKATLDTKFDIIETILAKQKFVAGNEFTLADLTYIPLAGVLTEAGVDFGAGRPNVARWLKEILGRDSWKSIQTNGLVSNA